MKKGTGQEECGQFPNIMLIYGHKADRIIVFMLAKPGHTQLSGVRILAVPLIMVLCQLSCRHLCT